MKIPFVASGSGANLYAHWGAAQCLIDNGIFPSKYIGTSGGAIAFGILANGKYLPKECLSIALDILPKKVMSFNWKCFIEGNWGLMSLNGLEKVLDKYVAINFENCRIPLYVTTTDLTTKESHIFCGDTTPKMKVSTALKLSASVPFLFAFTPMDNTIYTDGGVVNNYPIDLKIKNVIDLTKEKAIGIRLLSKGEQKISKPKNLFESIISVVGCMMSEIERKHIEDASSWSKTITIEVPWNSMDFMNVTNEVIEKIYKVGYDTVKHKLESGWNPLQPEKKQ